MAAGEDFLLIPVTIAAAASLSGAATLTTHAVLGFFMPAAWTAAGITFKGKVTATGTLTNLYSDAFLELLVPLPLASTCVIFSTALRDQLASMRYMQLRSGTSGLPVNQLAARTINLICERRK